MRIHFAVRLAILALVPLFLSAQEKEDVILRAMQDELKRSKALRIVDLDPPYFIEYAIEDADSFSVSATLGGLLGLSHRPLRALDVRLRVGSFDFDNTNYVLSGFRARGGDDEFPLPTENNYLALRQALWLSTDSAFKTAEEAIGRKRSALQNVNLPDQLPDFSKAQPVQSLAAVTRRPVDDEAWKARTVKLSEIFLGYPQIVASVVDFESIQSASYLANSEGTLLRTPDNVAYLRVRAWAQAQDGMPLRNAEVFSALSVSDLPSESDLRQSVVRLADELTALSRAPQGEDYTGPVIFESVAATELFAQVLGDNLKITRKPVAQPGRPVPHLPSELVGRIDSRILPEWMDIVDDPTQASWRGHSLAGAYTYDDEGIKAGPLVLVEKGVLKNFLLTRTPALKGLGDSNGRARLHGNYGAAAPSFGNLFVHAMKTVSPVDLKKRLIQLCQERGKPYGILIRKLDYPSSASLDELRRFVTAMSQSGSGTRPVSLPLLVYRIYPDGREELIRGMRFRGLSTRAFRDIVAASDDDQVFSFLDNIYPFALMGAAGYISPAAVIAPGVLFDEIDLERIGDELPKLPVVPPPALTGGH